MYVVWQRYAGVKIPAYQHGISKIVWVITEYGLYHVWVMTESTVIAPHL